MTSNQLPQDPRVLRAMIEERKSMLELAQKEREVLQKLAAMQEIAAANPGDELGPNMVDVMAASAAVTRVGLLKHEKIVESLTRQVADMEDYLKQATSNLVLPTMTRPPNTPRRN